MHRILITGSAGFLGSHLIEHFLTKYGDKNHPDLKVLGIDNLGRSSTHTNFIVGDHDKRKSSRVVDINDRSTLLRLFSEFKPTLVIHCAAQSHVDTSMISPSETYLTNVVGTSHVLEGVQMMQGKCLVIHVSTDEVFGGWASTKTLEVNTPVDQGTTPWATTPYATSKLAAEEVVKSYYTCYQVPAQIIRLTNLIGRRQNEEKFIPKSFASLKEGGKVTVHNREDGTPIYRQWLPVESACEGIYQIAISAMKKRDGEKKYQFPFGDFTEDQDIYQMGNGCVLSVLAMGHSISRLFHGDKELRTVRKVKDRKCNDPWYCLRHHMPDTDPQSLANKFFRREELEEYLGKIML